MAFRSVVAFLILSSSLGFSGCVSLEQINRDRLRYRAMDRGEEIFVVSNIDSLEAARMRNEQEIDLYQRHFWTAQGWVFPQPYNDLEKRTSRAITDLENTLKPYIYACRADPQEGTNALKFEKTLGSRKNLNNQLSQDFSTAATAKNDIEIFHIKLRLKQLQDQLKGDKAQVENLDIERRTAECTKAVKPRAVSGEKVSVNTTVEDKSANARPDYIMFAQATSVRPPVPYAPMMVKEPLSPLTVSEPQAVKERVSAPEKPSAKGKPSPESAKKESGKAKATAVQTKEQEPQIKQVQVPVGSKSQLQYIWPDTLIEKAKSTTVTKLQDGKPVEITQTGLDEQLLRALSSSAAIAQMRDLLTEPWFPPLLPTERRINRLGCLPPPDSAAFEAVMKLEASLKKDGAPVSIGTEFASSVVKLFEESERTLFLQYALFRLCEMSINAPAGFRNVYPVVVHDIVRRTAEMNELANKEAEQRRTEEQKTRQRELEIKLKEKEIEAEREKRFSACVIKRLEKDASDVAAIKSACAEVVKSQ